MLNLGSTSSPTSRAWFAAGIPILALVVVCMGMALAMLWGFAREQDEASAQTSSRLVESAWRARETASSRVALDYAVWNDAYLSTTVNWDGEWVSNNFYSNVSDAIFVVRADGTVRHAWVAEGAQAQSDAIRAAVVGAVQHQLNLGVLLSAPRKEDMTATTTMTTAAGALVLISAAPISPEEQTVRQTRDPDLPVDYLVAIDLVTPAELAEAGASLEAGDLKFSVPPGAMSDRARLYLHLRDASGDVLGALSWRRQRPGSDAFLGSVGGIICFLLLVGAMALFLAQKLVAAQLRAGAEIGVAHESNRMKSQFISTMSHELRTPLNAIMGYAEMIKEGAEEGAPALELTADADRVLSAAKHLARLINDVLDQSRIEAGKLQISLEPVEVAGVLGELEELMAPLAQANGNRLSITTEEGVDLVMADPMRLQQCLINLTGNALKFTQGGQVSVHVRSLTERPGSIVVEISDTGIGMSWDELMRLFKPFAQANKHVGAKYGGTGLGLSITRDLARAMGGDVIAESASGKGSTFRLSLRRAAGVGVTASKSALAEAA